MTEQNKKVVEAATKAKEEEALMLRAACLARHRTHQESLRRLGNAMPGFAKLARMYEEGESDDQFLARMESLGCIPATPKVL